MIFQAVGRGEDLERFGRQHTCIIQQKFCRKLHENKGNWTKMGVCPCVPIRQYFTILRLRGMTNVQSVLEKAYRFSTQYILPWISIIFQIQEKNLKCELKLISSPLFRSQCLGKSKQKDLMKIVCTIIQFVDLPFCANTGWYEKGLCKYPTH